MSFGACFGALVRKYREMQGISASELAKAALGDEAKRSRISELETGKVKNPHAKTVDALRLYLNIPQDEIDACRTATQTAPVPTSTWTNISIPRQIPSSLKH